MSPDGLRSASGIIYGFRTWGLKVWFRKFAVGNGLKMFDVFQEDCTEIYNAYGKDKHMKEIAEKSGIDLVDMIFFDNQTNNTSCVAGMKGPTVVYTPEGVTRALFEVSAFTSTLQHS